MCRAYSWASWRGRALRCVVRRSGRASITECEAGQASVARPPHSWATCVRRRQARSCRSLFFSLQRPAGGSAFDGSTCWRGSCWRADEGQQARGLRSTGWCSLTTLQRHERNAKLQSRCFLAAQRERGQRPQWTALHSRLPSKSRASLCAAPVASTCRVGLDT